MSWFQNYKKKKGPRCGLCKKTRTDEQSPVLKLGCSDGDHDVIVCESCFKALEPMVLQEK